MKFFLFSFFIFIFYIIKGQSISGYVKDIKTGESLPGVVISIENKPVSSTNSYGYFSVKLKKNTEYISFNLIGYKKLQKKISFKDTILTIYLETILTTLQEVAISTKKNQINNLQTSNYTLTQERIKSIPSITGTPDVLKVFQLLPGVQTATEGTTNLNVRGGSYDQNLILLDEAPIYNPAHALGFFSTFNADAIKTATIYKGNFPAQYGGRLSSVIDIIMKDGNNQQFNTDISIGLTANQFTVQGPIKKNKTSFLFSFRNSNVGNLIKILGLVVNNNVGTDEYIKFWDNNIKINHTINNRNKIYFSFYTGNDAYNFKILSLKNTVDWSNISSTIRWNHIYNKDLFSNLSLYTTNYTSINKNQINVNNTTWVSTIQEIGLKNDFTKNISNNDVLKTGVALAYRHFNPGVINQDNDSINKEKYINLNKNYNLEISMYLSREKEINDKLSINVGVRSSWFADLGPHYQYKIKTPSGIVDTLIYTDYGKIRNSFISFEPRITARYLINENSSLKGSISFVQQNLHLISNSTAGLPYDYWITASKEIKPQTSTQYLIGYFTNLFSKKISLSIEAYYKTLNNILDFKDNSNLLTEKSIEINTLQGIGRSYGVELFVEKNVGKHVGWISYTLARTQYKIENVNNDQWYSPRYDIRHNLSIVWIKKISDRKELSMTFKYTSGGFISLPTAIGNFDGALFSIYNFKNNYELPSYNRADLSYKLKTKRYFKSKLKKEWVFTLYNVYAKENIFSLVYRPVVNKPSDTDGIRNNPEFKIYNYNELYKFYLFSIIPTITFNVKF